MYFWPLTVGYILHYVRILFRTIQAFAKVTPKADGRRMQLSWHIFDLQIKLSNTICGDIYIGP